VALVDTRKKRRAVAGGLAGLGLLTALLLASAVGASAANRYTARAAGPLAVGPGEQIAVAGSKLRCVVSTASSASHPPTVVCGLGDLQAPLPSTYAFGIADKAAIVLRSSASRQPVLVVERAEPAPGRGFATVTHAGTRTVEVHPGAILLVGGSDVLCSVSTEQGGTAVTCGLAAGGSGTFVVDSYVAVISERVALLVKLLAGNKFMTVAAEKQPAG
jgi:hypothetical protein